MEGTDIRRVAIAALLQSQRQRVHIENISDDTPLGDSGVSIDSLSLLRAFIAVEDELGITINDAALVGAAFATVGDFVAFVQRIRGDQVG